MSQNISNYITSQLNNFFSTYDFYSKHHGLTPNGNTPFGDWKEIGISNEGSYTLECIYSYDNGPINDMAQCIVYIKQSNLNNGDLNREDFIKGDNPLFKMNKNDIQITPIKHDPQNLDPSATYY